jgi:ferritin-like metal-binding protein YciE
MNVRPPRGARLIVGFTGSAPGARSSSQKDLIMKLNSLQELFTYELGDIYSAEKQLVKALPKMARKASNPLLKQAIEDHLRETENHVARLEGIFGRLDCKVPSKTCKAMKGLIDEGSEVAGESGDPDVLDAGIIGAAQRVEHYEIAAYGCARTYAEKLGDEAAVELLQTTLDEEKATDQKLNDLAKQMINPRAAEA